MPEWLRAEMANLVMYRLAHWRDFPLFYNLTPSSRMHGCVHAPAACARAYLCRYSRPIVEMGDMDDFQPTNKRLRQHEANSDYFQPPTKRHEAEMVSGVCSACGEAIMKIIITATG